MKFHLKKDRFLIFFFAFLSLLLLTLVVCLLLLKHVANLQQHVANERYESYVIATLLRQTSDDLTNMSRLYVMTEDKKYRKYYDEILTIRAGTSPRPLKYNQVYWDLADGTKRPRPYGEAKSFVQLMIDHGFSLGEFELLREAENQSNKLAVLEIKAMNAVDGKFDDGSGTYSITGKPDLELARKLLFSDEYMKDKVAIMLPIQQFYKSVDERTQLAQDKYNRQMDLIIIIAIVLAILSTIVMLISIFKALKSLSQATQENELLLLNILPQTIANRLKEGEELIADEIPQASVLFSDIVGFTAMTEKFGATKMVSLLNKLFAEFDPLTEQFGVEKVKTIGDNYMAVAGVPNPVPDHALRLANFALAMREKLKAFNKSEGVDFVMRTGMTYGAVVAGVIGQKRFIYDVWGDVVNTASRMETTSLPGEIQITEKMAFMLGDEFIVEARDTIDLKGIEVKGKGMMKTYFLKGKKKASS